MLMKLVLMHSMNVHHWKIEVTISSSVTSIGRYAFASCSSLVLITFEQPSKLTSIGWDAFDGCSSLVQMSIPLSVTEIGISAFKGCSSLKQISIPSALDLQYLAIDSNAEIIRI